MNKIIVICGDLGAGKSTFAKIISDKFNIIHLTKDKIKELLADQIGFTNREENIKLSKASVELMFYFLDKIKTINQPLILEANFHNEEFLKLKEIVDIKNILIINLTGDVDILYKRFMNRINNENRHKAHQSAGLTNYDNFKKYLLSNRDINFNHFIKIDIDATDFSYQSDETTFKKIESFLNK